jgi:hypothetical protein
VLAGAVCALLLAACGGGSGAPGKASSRVDLSLSSAKVGAQLQVTLSAANAQQLHQLACRIAYDPQALRFAEARRGALVTSSAVFFSTTKGEGYVPVAFTYHPGEQLPQSSGSVATLTFDVLDADSDTGLRVVHDEDYLIARDAVRRSIAVTISGVAR